MTFKAKMTAMAAMLAAAGVMAQAQAAEVYNVGSNMAFAPFEFVDENNKPAGFEMELIVAIAKAQGAEVKLHNVPFDGLIPSLQTGAIDIAMSGITITDQRKRRVLFSTPYVSSASVIDDMQIPSFEAFSILFRISLFFPLITNMHIFVSSIYFIVNALSLLTPVFFLPP